MIEAGARALISRNSRGRVELGDLDEEHREEARDEARHVLQAALAALWSDDMESAPNSFEWEIPAPLEFSEGVCVAYDDETAKPLCLVQYVSVGEGVSRLARWAPIPQPLEVT
jgi:hypothetical protein